MPKAMVLMVPVLDKYIMERCRMIAVFRKNLLLIGVLLIGAAGSAGAQTMYRCGKSFQDRPCESAQPGQAIGRAAAPPSTAASGSSAAMSPAASATAGVDQQCIQRGAAAQQIKWGRETGLTEQAQLSSATTDAKRRLISDVYRRQGAASAIRAAVETDCVKENERLEQAALLAAAAAKLLGQNSPSPSALPVAEGMSSEKTGKPVIASDVSSRSTQCETLRSSVDRTREQQRAGGSASRMEFLNAERQGIEKRLSEAGC